MKSFFKSSSGSEDTAIEFLPDADEIERRPLPPMARLTLHVMLLLLIVFIIWATVSQIDQVITAKGRLVTPLPNIVVQPLETSIIQSIDVRIGQVVKKGTRLATLDPTFAQADEAQLRSRLKSLDTQTSRLGAELKGGGVATKGNDADSKLQAQLAAERQANYQAQLRKMSEDIARLQAELETNRHDQQSLTARLGPLKEMEAMQSKLVAQQFSSRARLLEAQDKRLEVERDMQLAQNREQELRRQLASAQAERAAFEKGWRQKTMEELLSTSRDRDSVNEQLQKADKRHSMVVLVAPSDAVVLDIAKLSQGSVVKEAEPLFTLVPLGSELEAEVQIESADVGYVKVGDETRLKFDAYPFQEYGTLDAKVRTISEDAFRRDANKQGADAFYMSRVTLKETKFKGKRDGIRLLPGMTLTAEIVVGKRSVISYLMWPLRKAMDESLQEP